MRLVAKIFISVMAVFCVAFFSAGYFLLSHSLETSVQRELEFALKQYQYDKFSIQAELIANETYLAELMEKGQSLSMFLSNLAGDLEQPSYLQTEDGTVLYSGSSTFEELPFEEFSAKEARYQVVTNEDECYILVGGRIVLSEMNLDFVTRTDITPVIEQQTILKKYFLNCLLLAIALATGVILAISALLTHPLEKMADAADRIADGNYHERLRIRQKGEVGELADSFNRMTVAVEDKVTELEAEARRKEDFVANFAHELKTPMTSVIGYADMIYQKELPRKEVKNAAWYIWNEGMRLEAMALKMMDLTVLNHQEIPLLDVPANEFLQDAVSGLDTILEEKKVVLECEAEFAYIKIDYDLMKTVFLNLIDNAIKADGRRLSLQGKRQEDRYLISLKDDGKGIPAEEISRITEAFYMVEKSRSRKQHGAGLGLSLVKQIVELHHGELNIESTLGEGTCVTISIPCDNVQEDLKEGDCF